MTVFLNSLWAAPAALGFALLFNVRKRALIGVMLLAVAGRLTRDLLIDAGLATVLASFVAALVIGILAYTIGPLTREASPVYAFAPVIPLIPGTYIFTALTSLVGALTEHEESLKSAELLASAASAGLIAAAITLALAVGATSPTLLFLRHRRDD